MIHEIHPNLFVADMEGCKTGEDIAIVHACKHPCYMEAVGRVEKTSKDYLFKEIGNNLYLNIVDSENPLLCLAIFFAALQFIEKHIENRKVIIHCNKGQSRSPSIAMLYLFRDLKFRQAENKMYDIYERYSPSVGINRYLGENWRQFQK